MKRTNFTRNALLLAGFVFLAGFSFRYDIKFTAGGVTDNLPVPKNVKDLLFYVQRDPDANTVIYQLNRTGAGLLNEAEPISIFWIRYAEGGSRKELNYIQRKFAYGLNTKKLAKDHYELTFVSYSKLKLYLRKNSQGAFQVYTGINQEQVILDRVFVRIEGGTFWVPNVLYVELKGRDAVSEKAVMERFKP
ncbi:DUF4833 domain-containing protein [Adhaeribacter sp. BT258]|uniref:DUF4833 domain-containing protein n=1 Tax=Adhaeribacter terrigena TaxID=2793070 RepID=A0ABS1C102_9BACT|nr:DUF4833 domain-containing protein [Adhaeribacter terrigena]MBK0403081.1 DUF4833 domain-containing protein [Adhaeribacter terrigena]